jgi:hypothetical protein
MNVRAPAGRCNESPCDRFGPTKMPATIQQFVCSVYLQTLSVATMHVALQHLRSEKRLDAT